MTDFAKQILNEKNFERKVELIYLFKKEEDIFFDNSIVFKAIMVKLFVESMQLDLDIDTNELVTIMLLCECKKVDIAQDMKKISSYAEEGADFLRKLGFSEEFCIIAEQHNRYTNKLPRRKESDILELIDQFCGMLIDRPERIAFPIEEALALLEYRNLKDCTNIYLEKFKEFINIVKEIKI